MSRYRVRVTHACFPLVLLGMLLTALAGCGGSQPDPSEKPDHPTTAASATSGTSDGPTNGADPSVGASASSGPVTLPPGAGLKERLLPVSALPAVGDGGWKEVESDPSIRVGLCNDIGVDAMGAVKSVRRDFADGEARVSNVVAQVPDRMTARRALQVLLSMQADCTERDDVRVGSLVRVPTRHGTGWWYPNATDSDIGAFGFAVVGKRIVLVALDHANTGQLATMDQIVRIAAARIR